jgi:CRP-like cAMP-binding protein
MPHEVTLAAVPLFSQLPKRTLSRLGGAITERRYRSGQTIVKQGDKADAFFIIEKGRVEVLGAGSGKKRTKLNELRSGAFFGEMALIDGAPRTATVKAVAQTDCLVLPRRAFMAELRANPRLALSMLPVLSMQFREDARDSRPMIELLRYV